MELHARKKMFSPGGAVVLDSRTRSLGGATVSGAPTDLEARLQTEEVGMETPTTSKLLPPIAGASPNEDTTESLPLLNPLPTRSSRGEEESGALTVVLIRRCPHTTT